MDTERTIEDARSVCRDLSTIFAEEGDFSEEMLDEVGRLCAIARLVTDDRYCQHELNKIERYATYLQAGDTRHWRRGDTPGNVHLRQLIIDLLQTMDMRLHTHALRRRWADVRVRTMLALQHARASVRG